MGNTKFDKILGLLEPLETDSVGEWIIDKEHKGTEDDPIHFPYPKYTEVVNELIDAVYEFEHENPEYELTKYAFHNEPLFWTKLPPVLPFALPV